MSRTESYVVRLPWPSFWAWSSLLCVGFVVWSICFLETDHEKLEILFDTEAPLTERVQATEQWIKLGEKAVPRLRDALKHEDLRTRAFSAYALGRIGKPAHTAIADLEVCMSDPSAKVRGNSLFALAMLDGCSPRVANHALNSLDDRDLMTWQTARDILEKCETRPVARLLALSDNEDKMTRLAVLQILQDQVADNEAVHDMFRRHLDDEDDTVRTSAYKALATHRRLTRNDLLSALDDSHNEIVRYGLRYNWSRSPVAELAASKMIAGLDRHSEDPRLVIYLLRAITQLGPTVKPFSEELVGWTTHVSSMVRSHALSALFECGATDAELIPALERLVNDSKEEVAFHAGDVAARASLTVQHHIYELLTEQLTRDQNKNRISAIAALAGMTGAEHVQTTGLMIEASTDQHDEMRFWAIRGLGRSQEFTPEVQTALQARLKDSRETNKNQTEVLVSIREFGPSAATILPSLRQCWDGKRGSVTMQFELSRTLTTLAPQDPWTIELLFNFLKSSRSAHVRGQALRLLSKIDLPKPQRLELFAIGQSDRRSEVRAIACGLLAHAELEPQLILDRLVKSLDDKNAFVRLIACRAVATQGRLAESAVSHLVAVANDRSNQNDWELYLENRVDSAIVREWQLNRYETVADAAKAALEAITESPMEAL